MQRNKAQAKKARQERAAPSRHDEKRDMPPLEDMRIVQQDAGIDKVEQPGTRTAESSKETQSDSDLTTSPHCTRDDTRLFNAEEEAKRLRGENDQLKASLSALKADVKDGFQARDEAEAEKQKLQCQLADLKVKTSEEIRRLKEENEKLRACSASNASQTDSVEKFRFVIHTLGKRVKELGLQLKEKNDQLAELMKEMNKAEDD